MSKIKIVTDSTAYIPDAWLEEYQDMIIVVPLTVLFGKDAMEDGLHQQTEFLHRLKKSPEIPTTSQPSPIAFETVFRRLKQEDADVSIIGIFISKKLSGTMVSAQTAAKNLAGVNIHLLDSQSTAAGLALLVRKTVIYVQQGLTVEEIISHLGQDIDSLRLIFVPNTLEYLKKGGRIGGASALLGTVLKIKPVLYLKEDVRVLDKVRTFKRAVERMLKELPAGYSKPLGIIHTADLEAARQLKGEILEKEPMADVVILEAGPVLATHAGPGALGIAFFGD